jgi:hypothetical protein
MREREMFFSDEKNEKTFESQTVPRDRAAGCGATPGQGVKYTHTLCGRVAKR